MRGYVLTRLLALEDLVEQTPKWETRQESEGFGSAELLNSFPVSRERTDELRRKK